MEQMTLGSPIHSPQSQYGSNTCGYLPSFLRGDLTQQPPGRLVSPVKMNRSVVAAPMSSPFSPAPTPGGFATPNRTTRTPNVEKPGPPISGLYSSFGTPQSGNQRHHRLDLSINGGGMSTPLGGTSTPLPSTPQFSFGGTPSALSYSARHDTEEVPLSSCAESNCWVTVFGFPPSAASYILSQFSQFGTVLQHSPATNGNWMHIRYQTKMQAQKAMYRSGRVMGGTIMVGVCVCSDSSVMQGFAEAADTSMRSNVPAAHDLTNTSLRPGNSDITDNVDSSFFLNRSTSIHNRSSIRPLTHAYKQANSFNENGLVGPQRNSGIVNKAMEYMFGW